MLFWLIFFIFCSINAMEEQDSCHEFCDTIVSNKKLNEVVAQNYTSRRKKKFNKPTIIIKKSHDTVEKRYRFLKTKKRFISGKDLAKSIFVAADFELDSEQLKKVQTNLYS